MTKPPCAVPDCETPRKHRDLCGKHYQRALKAGLPPLPQKTALQKFEERITLDETTGCWLWTGALISTGYGQLNHQGKSQLAHRWSYEHHVGPIPEGLVIDHLCRVPRCVNPSHLDPVPQRVNVLRGESPMAKQARQTKCIRGHELSGDNLGVAADGHRYCRACNIDYCAERRRRAGAKPRPAGRQRDLVWVPTWADGCCPRCGRSELAKGRDGKPWRHKDQPGGVWCGRAS